MGRRFILIGSVAILVVTMIVGFYFLRKKTSFVSDPLSSVPVDAALLLQINDFDEIVPQLFTGNEIFSDLNNLSAFEALSREVLFVDSLASQYVSLEDFLESSTVFLSGHHIGGRKVNFLTLVAPHDERNIKNLVGLLAKITGQEIEETEREYEGSSIYSLKTRGAGNERYYLAELKGNLLLSKSVILIENAIRQSKLPEGLPDDKEFTKIASTAGKNKIANLYIDLRKFTSFLSAISSGSFSQKLKNTRNFGGWSELDLNVNNRQIMLNGFASAGNAENSFLGIFDENEPVTFSVDKVLPSSTSAFVTIGAKDMSLLHRKFNNYLSALGKSTARKNQLQQLERKYDFRLEEIFTSILDNEITIAQAGYQRGNDDKPVRYVILKCKSGSQAESTLGSLVQKMCEVQKISIDDLKSTYEVDNDTKFAITRFPGKDLTGLLFGGLFTIPGRTYYTFLGNYLIFSESSDALGHFLYSNVLSRTLSTNTAYKSFSSNVDDDSFLLFYTNLSRSSSVFRPYLHDEIIKGWEQNYDKLQKIQSFGMQYTEVSSMGYFNLLLQYVDEAKGKPQTIWESLLDTSFSFKPVFVENHYTHQKEIFLQDENNTIYLINKAGRVLWKQTIAEPINSDVFQIDFYKNGKLQLLFSTENYLHLIDRNGNYVERYPVRLRDRATAGMALFDYENNRNYRIFIPCADNQVYAYSKEGNILNGWDFKGSETTVTQPINHFRIGNKDYIVFSDKYKTYVLNRRGDERVPVNAIFPNSGNNVYLENNGTPENSFMFTTDTSGAVIKIGFDGKVQAVRLDDFSEDHYFDLKDVNADGQKDFIILDRDELSVYTQKKEKVFHYSFPNAIQRPPIYFHFAYNDRKIGVTDQTDHKIYLLNNNGELYKGFPLEGHTLFSIGYLEGADKEFNLIVGGRNNFLYNYSVQ